MYPLLMNLFLTFLTCNWVTATDDDPSANTTMEIQSEPLSCECQIDTIKCRYYYLLFSIHQEKGVRLAHSIHQEKHSYPNESEEEEGEFCFNNQETVGIVITNYDFFYKRCLILIGVGIFILLEYHTFHIYGTVNKWWWSRWLERRRDDMMMRWIMTIQNDITSAAAAA
jgi:hypothetical protein